MNQKLLFISVFFSVIYNQLAYTQTTPNDYLVRSTTAVAGSSENISINNKRYIVQQSIGQSSAIGTFYYSDYTFRQGFIQPDVLAKIMDPDIPSTLEVIVNPITLSLEAVVYPNPFIQNITLSFKEDISGIIEIIVFDLYGRHVFSKSFTANQEIDLHFNHLSVANYILKVTANNKQFIKRVIKK